MSSLRKIILLSLYCSGVPDENTVEALRKNVPGARLIISYVFASLIDVVETIMSHCVD